MLIFVFYIYYSMAKDIIKFHIPTYVYIIVYYIYYMYIASIIKINEYYYYPLDRDLIILVNLNIYYLIWWSLMGPKIKTIYRRFQ